jgi:ubiquinone biosynthesis protein
MFKFGSIRRIKRIVSVLFDYEMHFLIDILELKMHLPIHKRFEPKEHKVNTHPETIRHVFEDLGGAFIKLGQLLALRPDLVGERYSKEFENLFADVPPEDPAIIKEKIKGIPFKKFDVKPIGSGSIAQVHKAMLGQKDVAVKIKRPDVDNIFHEDIQIMEYLSRKLKENYDPEFIDPIEIVEEFKRYTEKELSLRHEATNIKRFYRNFETTPGIRIPKVYGEYSDESILVMEYMEGNSILSVKTAKKGVIKQVTNAVYKMLFEDRFFHCDLHPGNIYVHGKEIIFLDFGIAGHIDHELERKLFYLFSSLVDAKLEDTAQALLDLNIGKDEPNEQLLRDGIFDVLGDYYNKSLKKMNFAKIFYGSIDVAKRSHIKLPAQLVLFGKSLVTMEGFCREVDPNFNVVANAKPYVHSLLKKRMKAGNMINGAKHFAFQFYQAASEFPASLKKASKMFTRLESRVMDIDDTFRLLTREIWRVSKLLTSTILFATFFISSVVLIDKQPSYYGFSLLSIAGFSISSLILLHISGLFNKKI